MVKALLLALLCTYPAAAMASIIEMPSSTPGGNITGSCAVGISMVSCITTPSQPGVASSMALSALVNSIEQAESAYAHAVLHGQALAAQSNTQDYAKLQATVKNTTIQAAQAHEAALLAGRIPLIGALACQQGSANGASLGADAGVIASRLQAAAISKITANYDKGLGPNGQHETEYSAINNAALLPQSVLSASNILPQPSGVPAAPIKPSVAHAYNMLVTNSNPLPRISVKSKATPGGTAYSAAKNVQLVQISIPQDVIKAVSLQNTDNMPLASFLENALNKDKMPSVAGTVQMSSSYGNVSNNTYLYAMNMLRFGNPTYWASTMTSTNKVSLEKDEAENEALEFNVGYNGLIMDEKMAAEMSNQNANMANVSNQGAQALRTAAIQQAIGAQVQ